MNETTTETLATPPKKFRVETIETIHRHYEVEAPDEDTAKKRVRLHWSDPDVLRDGLVSRLDAEEVSSRQVHGVTAYSQVKRS